MHVWIDSRSAMFATSDVSDPAKDSRVNAYVAGSLKLLAL